MKRVLFVGQAPSRSSDPKVAFSGRSGARLVDLSGLTADELWARVDAVNLLDYWPGQTKLKGDDFSVGEGRVAAQRLVGRLSIRKPRYELLVLVGRRVAEAFGLGFLDWFAEYATDPTFVVIPHPSGASRWWNDPTNVELARTNIRRWLR